MIYVALYLLAGLAFLALVIARCPDLGELFDEDISLGDFALLLAVLALIVAWWPVVAVVASLGGFRK